MIDLVSAVASTYFQLLEYRTALEIAKETVALRDSMHTLIDARFRGGIAAEIELDQARIQLAIAEAAVPQYQRLIGAAVAQRFPTISITGGLFGPLFNWGQNVRRVEIERLRTEEAAMRYEQRVLEALGEVQDALVAIRTLKDEQQAREAHVEAAVNAQFLSQQRYDKGVTSYLEALESQRQAFESQLLLASVRRQLLQNHVLLYRALGGGWPTEQEKKAGPEGR